MKKVEQIEKNIKNAKWHIESHKKQIEFYMDDDFDIDKIEEYSRKIKLLEVEIDALEWVIEDENSGKDRQKSA